MTTITKEMKADAAQAILAQRLPGKGTSDSMYNKLFASWLKRNKLTSVDILKADHETFWEIANSALGESFRTAFDLVVDAECRAYHNKTSFADECSNITF